jgi:ubiquinone/menaquinone biosynthesis C-methylase UbiE
MLGWFPGLRRGPSPHDTALAMVGVRAGDRVLVLGSADADLAAHIALVTGLNGSTTVADAAAGAAARVDAAAARAGALVEFANAAAGAVPFEPGTFDVAVIDRLLAPLSDADRAACATEALRVVRPGGRVIVIEPGTPTGWFRAGARPALSADQVGALLDKAGARRSRLLADANGRLFVEGLKGRD